MKRRFAIGVAVLALGGLAASASAAPWGASDPQQVCHATGSASNPYVLINPSAQGAANGHVRDATLGPSVGTRAARPHAAVSCSAGDGGGGGDGGGAF